MKTTKSAPKKTVEKKVATVKASKQKAPKFKLISYTMKATIPTGQYANIQPEVTVQAASIEAAERAVMPYFETLFAKYRDGGIKPVESVRPVASTVPTIVPLSAPKAPEVPKTPIAPATATIVLTAPFNRAKDTIGSCLSLEALGLVEGQVEKSEKLIPDEKQQLAAIILLKRKELNGK